MRVSAILALFTTTLISGCSDAPAPSAELPPPAYDAAAATAAALSQYDKNKNGSLEPGELESSPALKSALAAFDTNKDKAISTEELRARLDVYTKVPTGSVATAILVKLDDKVLDGATITLEPEKFLTALTPAVGTTDKNGRCSVFEVNGKKSSGVPAGLYTIRISKDGVTIPAKYNSQSTLGCEVMYNPRMAEVNMNFKLTTH